MTLPSQPSSGSRWLDHAFVPLLLVVYVVATFAPAPVWLASVALPWGPDALEVGTSKLILACLLFVAGLRMALPTWPKTPLSAVGILALGVVGRMLPLAGMIAITHALVAAGTQAVGIEIATGLLLVAAMPSANTSIAWTRRAEGSLAVCVGVVLLTTLASPLVIPAAVAMAAGPAGMMDTVGEHVFAGVGIELIAWVVIPMMAGMTVGWLVGARDGVPLGLAGSCGSLVAILAINYLNASRALPQLLTNEHLLPLLGAATASALLVAMTYAGAGLIARSTGAPPKAGVAISYAVGMSNTGLAGTLANEAFAESAVILYPIVLCTLVQHVMAAAIDSRRQKQAALLESPTCEVAR
jgi:BASS family bile acid:Na+ symporter